MYIIIGMRLQQVVKLPSPTATRLSSTVMETAYQLQHVGAVGWLGQDHWEGWG